jgi:hypothetical protein
VTCKVLILMSAVHVSRVVIFHFDVEMFAECLLRLAKY